MPKAGDLSNPGCDLDWLGPSRKKRRVSSTTKAGVLVLVLAASCVAVAILLPSLRSSDEHVPVIEGDAGETSPVSEDTDADVEGADASGIGASDVAPAQSVAVLDAEGAFLEPPAREDYGCEVPAGIVIPQEGCEDGAVYPACRWMLPDASDANDVYRVWRNTTPEHRWAQPALIALVIAVAADHARRWPGEIVTIGDLDAPGPRHQTHDLGHDVDLYLENALMETNIGGGHYIDNYVGRPSPVVRMLRARVLDLAKNLATCSGGRLRIYYNDPEILTPFLSWFEEHSLVSDVGPAMVEHNRLHRFHFHMTIADGMEPLPHAR